MNRKGLISLMKTACSALVLTSLLLTGTGAAVQAENANTKAVKLSGIGDKPIVLDERGELWGLSLESRAWRMNKQPFRGTLMKVDTLDKVADVSYGGRYGFVVKEDGTVWTIEETASTVQERDQWGENKPKVIGQVPGLREIVKVQGNMALDQEGNLWSWELVPSYDKRGDWEKFFKEEEPSIVPNVGRIKDFIGFTLLKEDGTVWTWDCDARACNPKKIMMSQPPVQIEGLEDIVKLGSGGGVFGDRVALKKDGTVWIWGGLELLRDRVPGNGTKVPPFQVEGLTDIIDVSFGTDHVLALKKDGTVWSMGYFPEKYAWDFKFHPAQQVNGLSDVASVYTTGRTNAVIKKDGTIWMWGYDYYGLFGEDWDVQANPVQVELKS
jgi:alpha-tubulin suppressor-like RCC1 family protein